jgi:hypothetical protein
MYHLVINLDFISFNLNSVYFFGVFLQLAYLLKLNHDAIIQFLNFIRRSLKLLRGLEITKVSHTVILQLFRTSRYIP